MRRLFAVLLLVGGLTAAATVPAAAQPTIDLRGRLFYLSDRTGGPTLWVLDLDRRESRMIADFSGTFSSIGNLDVSPDGQRLVFGACAAIPYDASRWEIWVINSDGTGLRQVTDWQSGRWTSEHAPAWSPTEEGVVYYLHDLNWDGYPRRLNVDTLEDTEVPRLVAGSPWYLDVTNDGTRLVVVGSEREFGLGEQPSTTTYTQRIDGTEWHRIREPNNRTDGFIDLNRGDGWLAFVETTALGWNPWVGAVWKMNPEGGDVQLLAEQQDGYVPHHVAWAGLTNDGPVILIATLDGNTELVAMRPSQVNGLTTSST